MRYVSGGHACTYMLATLKPFFLLAHRHGYHAEYDNKEDTRQEQPHILNCRHHQHNKTRCGKGAEFREGQEGDERRLMELRTHAALFGLLKKKLQRGQQESTSPKISASRSARAFR